MTPSFGGLAAVDDPDTHAQSVADRSAVRHTGAALTAAQRRLLDEWLGQWRVVENHSWGLTDTAVLHAHSDRGAVIIKSGGPYNRHIGREIHAHREWTGPWRAEGRAAELVAADADAGVCVLTRLPGELVLGTPAQHDPEIFRQAGRLIAAFHQQFSTVASGFHGQLRDRALRFLGMPHRIDPEVVRRARAEVDGWPDGDAVVVPTHGDWHPRNWLDDGGVLRVIDLGRAALRVPEEDFVRLARQDFVGHPEFEAAYLEGYGSDPRDPDLWRRINVAEALGTAAWAFEVGDRVFEHTCHAHLARLYAGSS